jgi:hypothetical protein
VPKKKWPRSWQDARNSAKWRVKGLLANLKSMRSRGPWWDCLTSDERDALDACEGKLNSILYDWSRNHASSKRMWEKRNGA